jgi:hypothetical protein
MSKTAINITTIHVPIFIKGICNNLKKHNISDASILVIGDVKTPPETENYCRKMAKKFDVEIEYLDIKGQEKALAGHEGLLELFPYNTPDRVILGGMLSYLRGYDRLIAVDDDNYTTGHDFVGFHSITGKEVNLKLIKNATGWFNVHSALKEENNIPFYPRGFPWKQRNPRSNQKTYKTKKTKVVVNQGLVLENPDIDAISRLFNPIRATAMKSDFNQQFGLYPGTWSPFNYQNTSLCREIIPLYYRPISTMRNADIWTSYLINKLAEHFDHVITFGQPLVKQIRNPHNLWEDLDVELINNRATDDFIFLLRNIELTKSTYFEALGELLTKCQKDLRKMKIRVASEKEMINKFFIEYQKWYKIVAKIAGN